MNYDQSDRDQEISDWMNEDEQPAEENFSSLALQSGVEF